MQFLDAKGKKASDEGVHRRAAVCWHLWKQERRNWEVTKSNFGDLVRSAQALCMSLVLGYGG